MDEQIDFAHNVDVFHEAFSLAYVRAARASYRRAADYLPYRGQDVHIIHGGKHWWHIVCISGQGAGNLRIGPAGRYNVDAVDAKDWPDLELLQDEHDPRKEDFRLNVGIVDFIYHQAFAPPFAFSDEDMAQAGVALALEMVQEHAAGFDSVEKLRKRVTGLRNGHQLAQDISETMACLLSEHYRAAIATSCAAAESALLGRLEELGHPIRKEERARLMGHERHYLSGMIAEAYRQGAISAKARDRLDMLDSLRRGTDHCRPDATVHDDAVFAWATLELTLGELVK